MTDKPSSTLWARALDLFSDEEDPNEPVYDPVHIGGTVIVSLVGIGCLYWILWTLLVFEGGIFTKIGAALQAAFTSKTLQDLGYQGAYDMGAFEGWFGNTIALLLGGGVLFALHRALRDAAGKS